MKVALVHDSLVQKGGAEAVFRAIARLYPEASVFSPLISSDWQKILKKDLPDLKLIPSIINQLPFSRKIEKVLLGLYPIYFDSLDLTGFDLVMSSSARFAHGVVTGPNTFHAALIHSPPRFLWQGDNYFSSPAKKALLSPLLSLLRHWDWVAAQRPDLILGNSNYTLKRITKIYARRGEVVYPFYEESLFAPKDFTLEKNQGYFLVVSRLVYWKRIDLAVKACSKLNLPLKIVGVGPHKKELEKIAGPSVEFLGRISDNELVRTYQGAKAVIHPQKEDFGIVPVEAMACGTPVIAFAQGGARETVQPGLTGKFFYRQSVASLAEALENFRAIDYRQTDCVNRAKNFARAVFLDKFRDLIQSGYERHLQSLKKDR